MLSLRNFVVSPGNRPGERRVYARLSDGTLRRVRDPKMVAAVLLRYDAGHPVDLKWYRRWWDAILRFLRLR
jgi:hypothetical protein